MSSEPMGHWHDYDLSGYENEQLHKGLIQELCDHCNCCFYSPLIFAPQQYWHCSYCKHRWHQNWHAHHLCTFPEHTLVTLAPHSAEPLQDIYIRNTRGLAYQCCRIPSQKLSMENDRSLKPSKGSRYLQQHWAKAGAWLAENGCLQLKSCVLL